MGLPTSIDSGLTTTEVQSRGHVVVTVRGEVDIASAATLRATLLEVVRASRRVIVDLSEVPFLDAAGLGALVATAHRANEAGAYVRLVGADGPLPRLLRIAHLSQYLPVYGSVTEAMGLTSHHEHIDPVALLDRVRRAHKQAAYLRTAAVSTQNRSAVLCAAARAFAPH